MVEFQWHPISQHPVQLQSVTLSVKLDIVRAIEECFLYIHVCMRTFSCFYQCIPCVCLYIVRNVSFHVYTCIICIV